MGALVSALVLFFGSIFILTQAVPRLINPQTVYPRGMLGLAILGIVVNGIAVWKLKGGRKVNERVISLHLLEDVLGWTAILLVSILLLFFDLPFLDPLLSILITGFILVKIIPNIRQTVKVFLQYSPGEYDLRQIEESIRQNPGVADVHDLHIWSLDGTYTVLTGHVAFSRNLSLVELDREQETIKDSLRDLGIDHITLESELHDKTCRDCKL
jgi:cobalt-zinc-cadmium efflux system protein